MSRVLIREGSGRWAEPELAGYAREDDLQLILGEHPELIPGVSSTAIACREFQSEVGPADIVVLDKDGQITLVECKLASNRQIRREIVGQLFDYAARLWRMDIELFARKWADRTGEPPFSADDSGDLIRDAVARNLDEGAFRLVLAVDGINEPLKRMVEYLNSQAALGASVVAVSYTRYQHGALEMLMPQLYGQELAESKAVRAESGKVLWDEHSWRDWLVENRPEDVRAFNLLFECVESFGWSFNWSRSMVPSAAVPIQAADGRMLGKISVFYYRQQGVSLEFNFEAMADLGENGRPSPDEKNDFLKELESIPGLETVAANMRSRGFRSRGPNVPLSKFEDADLRRALGSIVSLASASA